MSKRLVNEGSARGDDSAVELRFRVDRSFGVSRDQGLLWLDAARYGDMRTLKAIADGVLKKGGGGESGHDREVKRGVGGGQHDGASRASENRESIDDGENIGVVAFSKPALWRLAHYNGQGTSYGFIGSVALHWAAANGDIAMCQMLLDPPYSTAVNCQNLGGSTPLHSACSNGRLAVAQLLLSYGANPLVADVCGDLPADVIPPPSVARMRSAESEELLQRYQNRRGRQQVDHHGTGGGGGGRKGRKTKQQKRGSSDPLADLRMVMKGATMVSSLLEKYGIDSLNNATNARRGTTTNTCRASTSLSVGVGDCVAKWSVRELKLVADSLGAYLTQEEEKGGEESGDRGGGEEDSRTEGGDGVAGSLRGGAASTAAGSRGGAIGEPVSSADAVGLSQQIGLEKEDYVRLCRKIVERWIQLRKGRGGRRGGGTTDEGDDCDDGDENNDASAAQFLSSVQERHLLRLLKAEQMRHDRLQAKRLAGCKEHSGANDGGGGATRGDQIEEDADEDEDEDAEEIRLLEVARKRADAIKEKANALLRQPTHSHSPSSATTSSSLPDYKGAIKLYTSAISVCPTNSVLYSNRAACFLGLVRQQEQQFGRSGRDVNSPSSSSRTSFLTSAVRDCKSAMLLDVTYVKPIYRLAQALSLLGRHKEVKSLVGKTLARAIEGGQSAATCETLAPTMSNENINGTGNSISSFLPPLSLAQEDVDAFRSLLLLAEGTHSGGDREARSGAKTKANGDAAGIEAANAKKKRSDASDSNSENADDGDSKRNTCNPNPSCCKSHQVKGRDGEAQHDVVSLRSRTSSAVGTNLTLMRGKNNAYHDVVLSVSKKVKTSSTSLSDHDDQDDDSSDSFSSSFDGGSDDDISMSFQQYMVQSCLSAKQMRGVQKEDEENGEKDSLRKREKKSATPFSALLTAAASTSTSPPYVNPASRRPWFDCPLCENRTRDQVNTACCGKALCGTCLTRKTASSSSGTNGFPKCPFCEGRLS